MAERKDHKTKRAPEDQKTMVNMLASGFGSFFGQQMAERKYLLIEINPHPDHEAIVHHYLSPVNLRHVTIFDNQVILYCGYDDQIKITMQEWERIRSLFGYAESDKTDIQEQEQTK